MVPPGFHRYFYSTNGQYTFCANAPLIVLEDSNLKIIQKMLLKYVKDQRSSFKLKKLNYLEVEQNPMPLINKVTYEIQIKHCQPRAPRPVEIIQKKADIIWSIPLSIFKDYNTETDAMVIKCFEFDW